MIEAFVSADLIQRLDGTGLGIIGPVDDAAEAGVHNQSCAHRAGFEGDGEGAVVEAPVVDCFAGVDDRGELGVAGGVFVALAGVGAGGEDFAGVGFVDDCADGDFALLGGGFGEVEGFGHHVQVGLGWIGVW